MSLFKYYYVRWLTDVVPETVVKTAHSDINDSFVLNAAAYTSQVRDKTINSFAWVSSSFTTSENLIWDLRRYSKFPSSHFSCHKAWHRPCLHHILSRTQREETITEAEYELEFISATVQKKWWRIHDSLWDRRAEFRWTSVSRLWLCRCWLHNALLFNIQLAFASFVQVMVSEVDHGVAAVTDQYVCVATIDSYKTFKVHQYTHI